MINNDVLRSVRYMLDLSDAHVSNLIAMADPGVVLEREQVQAFLRKEDLNADELVALTRRG